MAGSIQHRRVETIFNTSKVENAAAELQASDPDWTYKVKHDPKGTGGSLIEIYDEDGVFVSYY